MKTPTGTPVTLALVASLWAAACAPGRSEPGRSAAGAPEALVPDAGELAALPAEPLATAGSGFWERWGDGRAELSGYRVTTRRYGEPRRGELTLVYVTEPHDRRTWIKDDGVEDPHRVQVLKLNVSLKFLTGIYPYSVLTSVFAPVDRWWRERERFTPVKITMSAQEWCGHVFHGLWPGDGRLRGVRLSYFAGEGETTRLVDVPANTLYEDALLIQLREPDGPFAGGDDWTGWMVPSLWGLRRGHGEPEPVRGEVRRTEATRDGVPVTRFEVRYGDVTRTVDVERAPPRRILGWTTSDGERAELVRSERLAYWRLNRRGDEARREEMGLSPEGPVPPAADPARPGGAPGGTGPRTNLRPRRRR